MSDIILQELPLPAYQQLLKALGVVIQQGEKGKYVMTVPEGWTRRSSGCFDYDFLDHDGIPVLRYHRFPQSFSQL